MFSSTIVSLALAASALANVYITAPVATTSWAGGQQQTITWQDDGGSPSLSSFGPAKLSIYVGNANQQASFRVTPLQLISANTDVSKLSSLSFTPDPTIGPDSDEYFIRVESLSLKDASQPQYPALAFSSKFTLTNMSGTFNSTLQAEIDGQSTAPIGGTTSAAATGTASSSATKLTTTVATSTKSASASASASATSTSSSNGAGKHGVTGVAGIVGIAAALIGATLL
ncbi:hypothetical protein ID866_7109 [Astraeus odoratus]|nr:hypothetical protein ID866_7109 [Astraeus odoratus]